MDKSTDVSDMDSLYSENLQLGGVNIICRKKYMNFVEKQL